MTQNCWKGGCCWKGLKQKLISDVEKAKQEHFENNLNNVKIQTEEMQKLVKIALEKVRAEFQEKLVLIKEIQEFEENLREKMGNYKKEFDDMDTKVVAMTILTSLQGINWFCLYEDTEVTAENYIKTSMDLLIKSLKRR